MVKDKVIVGKDGFLFLGNKYNSVAHQTTGVVRPSEGAVERWSDRLKYLQQWYEKRGIKFLLVIAPNKHSIYREKLPDWMAYEDKTVTDDIMRFAKSKNLNILDLRAIFDSYKKSSPKLLYQKSDTHWNNIASGIAYNQTIETINAIYAINLKRVSFETVDKKYRSGDLSGFLKIGDLLGLDYENIYQYQLKKSTVEFSTLKLGQYDSMKMKRIKNRNFFINRLNYLIKNQKALNSENLLFVCDSFASNGAQNVGNSILYNETFNSVVQLYFHMLPQLKEPYLEALVKRFDIKTVIYQVVERDIFEKLYLGDNINIVKVERVDQAKREIFDLATQQYAQNNEFKIAHYGDEIHFKATQKDPIIILDKTRSSAKKVLLSYEVDAGKATTFQIYYKESVTSKYSEKETYRVKLQKGINRINLLLPSKYINHALRVDLVSDIGEYKIKKFKIYEVGE
jgi:hypothetical protein